MSKNKGKIAVGAIFGAVAGAVAGILTAPKSGKETRADIKAKSDQLKVEADKKVVEVKEKATDLKKRTKRAVAGAKKGFNDEKF